MEWPMKLMRCRLRKVACRPCTSVTSRSPHLRGHELLPLVTVCLITISAEAGEGNTYQAQHVLPGAKAGHARRDPASQVTIQRCEYLPPSSWVHGLQSCLLSSAMTSSR